MIPYHSNPPSNTEIFSIIAEQTQEFSRYFRDAYQKVTALPDFSKAVCYGCDGGKRIRPYIMLEIGGLLGVSRETLYPVATAVEMIHAYSLVHDDLPAMDDDDLRRGQPSVHKKFDEATAILIGDALQAEAFGVLSEATAISSEKRLRLVSMLSASAGGRGMVAGQVLDIQAEGKACATIEEMQEIQNLKTGAIFRFCCCAPVVLSSYSATLFEVFDDFSVKLGHLFQLSDDIIGATVHSDISGKTSGSDARHQKSTLVKELGLKEAKCQAGILSDQAVTILQSIKQEKNLQSIENLVKLLQWLPHRLV